MSLLRVFLLPLSAPSRVGCRLSYGTALAVDGAIDGMARAVSRISGQGETASGTDRQAGMPDRDG